MKDSELKYEELSENYLDQFIHNPDKFFKVGKYNITYKIDGIERGFEDDNYKVCFYCSVNQNYHPMLTCLIVNTETKKKVGYTIKFISICQYKMFSYLFFSHFIHRISELCRGNELFGGKNER